ncbi:MAG: DNA-directed RNA polymerase subunit omega [Myxococcota bacterium]
MARVTVEDCLRKVDNRFALVLLAATRSRQLMRGSRPLVESHKNNEQVVALREVAAGKLRFDRDLKEVLQASLVDLREQSKQTQKLNAAG